jgi:hypothetical protein
MRKSKVISTFLTTIALLAGGLPVILSAAPASAAVATIPNLPARWSSIASPGTGVTCAIATNSTIWCWGIAEGVRGVTWDPLKGDPVAGTSIGPKQVGSAANWTKVALVYGHACAENTLQEIWCWGSNAQGQLGTSNFVSSQVPVLVKSFGKKWNDFDLVGNQSCAVSGTAYWCWGNGLALPSIQTLNNTTVNSGSEVQLGEVTAIKTGSRIWLNDVELSPPLGQTWSSFQVARKNDFAGFWAQDY